MESVIALLEENQSLGIKEATTVGRCLVGDVPQETPADFHHIVAGIRGQFPFDLFQNHLDGSVTANL